MATVSGGNSTNKVKVSNTKAEYYSDLTKGYMEKTQEYMEICQINSERSDEQYKEITSILEDLPTTKQSILDEITNLSNDKIEDIAEATEEYKTAALEEMNAVKAENAQYTNTSKDWAVKMDGMVDGEDYSSKYYASRAAESSAEAAASKVSKTGDTMSGALAIQMSVPNQSFKNTSITIDDDNFQTVGYINFKDSNGAVFAGIATNHTASGNQLVLTVYDQNGTITGQPLIFGRNASSGDYCSFPMAKTTPTATATARANLISAVVANYRNENSWYLKFSDNFKIQGGYATTTGDGHVTLVLPLSALFAGVSTQAVSISDNTPIRICNQTGTGFDYNTASPFYWVVYGW